MDDKVSAVQSLITSQNDTAPKPSRRDGRVCAV